jgi:hypothetical protein
MTTRTPPVPFDPFDPTPEPAERLTPPDFRHRRRKLDSMHSERRRRLQHLRSLHHRLADDPYRVRAGHHLPDDALVWDTLTDTPASVYGRWQTSMELDDADDLTDLLNLLERRRISGH